MENQKTALDSSYNHSSNMSNDYDIDDYNYVHPGENKNLICWYYDERGDLLSKIVIGIFFPMSLLAIYSLYFQIRSERVVPVFIINLLISDVLQVTCMLVNLTYDMDFREQWYLIDAYNGFVLASVFFMSFIALERYLMIAQPLWYRFSKLTRIFASISVPTWILSILIGFMSFGDLRSSLFLPFPFMIFSLVGTLRALSTVQAVPAAKKRRIVAVLVVVFLIYTVMFLPYVLAPFLYVFSYDFSPHAFGLYFNFMNFSCMLIQISPLTDILLYIFLKKRFLDELLTSLCCCIKSSDESQQTSQETGSSTYKSKEHENP